MCIIGFRLAVSPTALLVKTVASLMRKRPRSPSREATGKARKPCSAGQPWLLSVSMIVCNYVHAVWLVVGIMSLAYFGKGVGSLGWAVVSDTAPKHAAGLCGGIFNMFGNTAAITTPIVIGYIVQETGSFNGALVFVAANAVIAIVCYLLVVGDIRRVELRLEPV